MRRVARYQVFDGQEFKTEALARNYIDVRISERLSKMAGAIVKLDKYQDIKQYLYDHLDEFCELSAYKEDMEVDNPEDE